MIFLMKFGINKHLSIFPRPQILLVFGKNLLVLIYSKFHEKNHVITYTSISYWIADVKSHVISFDFKSDLVILYD